MMAIIGAFTSLIGALFFLLSGVGLIRMPDAFNRLQVGTKSTTLGSILFLIGIGLQKPDYLGRTIILVVFIVLTNPVSSNALARAAHGYRKHIGAKMVPDALAEANALAEAGEASAKTATRQGTSKEAAHGD